MIKFLEPTTDVGTALSGTYDVPLVVLSYAIAVFASYAGFLLGERVKLADTPQSCWMWIAAGSATMGIGVWAMHFTGLLAFVLPVPVAYDLGLTIASIIPAMLASGVVLYVIGIGKLEHRRLIIAGILMGVGIGVMHYTGMAAMRMPAVMQYDPTLFALSIFVAVTLGIAAFYVHRFTFRPAGFGGRIGRHWIDAALMGLAVTGMHYTAMAATYYFPTVDFGEHVELNRFWLQLAVIVVTVLIIAIAIVTVSIDRRWQSEVQLARVTRQRVTEAIESISDGFALFDSNGALLMWNNVFSQMYPALQKVLYPGVRYERVIKEWAKLQNQFPGGMSAEEYVAQRLQRFDEELTATGYLQQEQLADGRWTYFRQHSVASGGIVCVWTDISSIKKLQDLYKEAAHHDALTGLPNRQLFNDRLDHAASHARRLNGNLALLYVDLDGFKPINDKLGHDAGDSVLKEVARRLQVSVRETDTAARLGGDEFAVILEPQADRESAELVAERILKCFSEPISVGETECVVGASIGIAIMRADEFDKDSLVKMADVAMYEAKNAGRNCYRVKAA